MDVRFGPLQCKRGFWHQLTAPARSLQQLKCSRAGEVLRKQLGQDDSLNLLLRHICTETARVLEVLLQVTIVGSLFRQGYALRPESPECSTWQESRDALQRSLRSAVPHGSLPVPSLLETHILLFAHLSTNSYCVCYCLHILCYCTMLQTFNNVRQHERRD